MPLDLDFVRSQFPALVDGFAFFDNAGGSLVLKTVADRVSNYLLTTSVQTGAGYEHSQRASARLGEARRKIARLVNAQRPEEIVLGPSTTVLMRFLNPQRHRFVCCDLTKCAIAIERDRRPRLFNDFGMVVNSQMPLTPGTHIAWDHANTM